MPKIAIVFWKLFFFFEKQALAFGLTTKILMMISVEIFKIVDVTYEQQKKGEGGIVRVPCCLDINTN